MMGRYKTEAEDIAVISGKLACAKKGIAFCQAQLTSDASKFKVALVGSSCEESRKIIDIEGDSVDDANEDGMAAMMIARTKTRQWFLTMCLTIWLKPTK